MMEGHRQNTAGGRRRKRTKARSGPRAAAEPLMIVARRPNSPLLVKPTSRTIAASAEPKSEQDAKPLELLEGDPRRRRDAVKDRSSARIVQRSVGEYDAREGERLRLLDRILLCEGRSTISRAVDIYLEAGFELPLEQEVQLQLLEHVREDRAREAVEHMSALLDHAEPIKRPILIQRLRRLEEYADEEDTRRVAADLLRALR